MYKSAMDIINKCNEKDKKISEIVIENECKIQEQTSEQIKSKLYDLFLIMEYSCKQALEVEIKSISGMTGGDAKKVYQSIKTASCLSGKTMLEGVAYALSCIEVNASMGKIVAAPTAGSCGIIPGCIMTVANKLGSSKEDIISALLTASGIGQIIARNATLSGAQGGCQAECGSAAAMAAAAIVEMNRGSVLQSFNAAAMTIKNVMGLICDPVAGLVEAPCAKRNAMGVANAILCADLALAGVESLIPFDEVVDAMFKVGKQMPCEFKETALGGLAVTPTAKRLECEIFNNRN